MVRGRMFLLTFSSGTKLLFSVDAACFSLLDVLYENQQGIHQIHMKIQIFNNA